MTWTKLHDACEHQDVRRVIEIAHEDSEEAAAADANGSTPLHLLVWGNPDPKAVEALLEASPQAVSTQDVHGDTALHVACSCPTTDKHTIHLLLEACPKAASMTNHEGLMPIHTACRCAPANECVIGLLIEAHPYALLHHVKIGDPPPPGGKPVGLRPKETDHVLIDQTAGMASKRFSDLHFAATGRQVRDGAYPLHMAAAAKAPAPVIEMLVRGADSVLTKTNKRGETPLHVALRTAGVDEEVVETLVRCGPGALRVRDGGHGNLPIHAAMAAAECSVRVAKALLETWPGSVHERNAAGLTPLELALRHGKCSDEVLRLVEISDRAT